MPCETASPCVISATFWPKMTVGTRLSCWHMLVIIALLVMRVVVVVTMLAGWPGAETGGTLFELR